MVPGPGGTSGGVELWSRNRSPHPILRAIRTPEHAKPACGGGGGGGGGGSNVQPAPPNRSPVAAADKTVTLDEDAVDQALSITAPTDPDGGNLTITVTAVPTGGTLKTADGTEVTSNTTLTISQLTGLVFTPDTNLNSDSTEFGSFTYSVSDGSLSDAGSIAISVTAVNDAPTGVSLTGSEFVKVPRF